VETNSSTFHEIQLALYNPGLDHYCEIAVTGEAIVPGLYITPAVGTKGRREFTGLFVLTHRSGLAVTEASGACIDCVRLAAHIAIDSDVDWDRDKDAVLADIAARDVASRISAVMRKCRTKLEQERSTRKLAEQHGYL
jgi:hypothetical protein